MAIADLETLIKHGLHALRDTLQQDKELTPLNTSIGIVGASTSEPLPSASLADPSIPPPPSTGLSSAAKGGKKKFEAFKVVEGDDIQAWLDKMDPKEGVGNDDDEGTGVGPAATRAAAGTAAGDEDTAMET